MLLEEHKRRERAQAIGLFRYQLICPALDEELSSKQRGKLVREIAAATHTDPFGNQGSRPKAGVNGAGHRFCFETYQVIEERTYARACSSITD